VGDTIHNNHTLEPYYKKLPGWVLILEELRNLLPSLIYILSTTLPNTPYQTNLADVPFPVLLSTLIRSRFQAKPATLLISIDFPFPFRGGGAQRYSVPKWLLFLI
jgi:hypothetical protein